MSDLEQGDNNKMALRPLVLTGPSGGGKSTILKLMFKAYPGAFAFSVSHTTRKPRPGEVDGKDYFFTDRETIQSGIQHGEFLEHTEFSGNIYGTSLKAVQDVQKTGKICVLDLDLPGIYNIRASVLHKNEATRPKYILIRPPSMEILEQRLRGRGTETEETLRKRLNRAITDMKAVEGEEHLFDHVIINDTVDRAGQELIDSIREDLDKVTNASHR